VSVQKPVILPFGDQRPRIAPDAFIAPNATVVGDVEIGAGSSLWFNVVVRGDVHSIRIGAGTNIQDGSVVHVTTNRFATVIGDNVSVGHMALLHGCTLEDGAFVGMAATVMDGCVIEGGGMLAAGSLLTPGKRIKAGELWSGRPAVLMRPIQEKEVAMMANTPKHYATLAARYRATIAGL
jgi:carbonic anhydrase/acetyltransferase-like protein (isoleucine patch superfamily)